MLDPTTGQNIGGPAIENMLKKGEIDLYLMSAFRYQKRGRQKWNIQGYKLLSVGSDVEFGDQSDVIMKDSVVDFQGNRYTD